MQKTTPPTDVYRAKAASPHAWLENLAWNPDGTRFAFCAIFDAYPAEIVIGELKDGKWKTKRVRRDGDRTSAATAPRSVGSATTLVLCSDERQGRRHRRRSASLPR